MTVGECVRELEGIVRELDDIESSLRRDFDGIGEDLAANCISRVSDNYRVVIRKLNNVNPNRLSARFAQS
jgi:hypothetical protein